MKRIVHEKYILQPVQAVSKYTDLCKQAALCKGVVSTGNNDNYITRVKVDELTNTTRQHVSNSGYFIEYAADLIDEILPLCTEQCQTVSYYGVKVEDIQEFILKYKPNGIDRVVPIGKTMNFGLIWDGHDLIYSLSRKIGINIY
jgi:hypothetical protein